MMLRSVDLPLPEGPTIATNSLFFIARFIPWRAATLPAVESKIS
jgi:hypothetical protein